MRLFKVSLVLLVPALLMSRLAEAQCGGSVVYLSIALPAAFSATSPTRRESAPQISGTLGA